MDPRACKETCHCNLSRMLYAGLTKLGADGKVHFCLADSVMISQDLKSYTFRLKESYWSDGSFCTAYDFELSWKSLLHSSFLAPFAHLMFVIKNAKKRKFGFVSEKKVGIKAIDKSTLKIDLEAPTPHFLELLAAIPFFCIHRKYLNESFPSKKNSLQTLVSNGPFSLDYSIS